MASLWDHLLPWMPVRGSLDRMIVEESGRILLDCHLLNHTGSSRHNRVMDRASVKVGWESFPSGRCVRALASTKTGMRYDGSVGCHPPSYPPRSSSAKSRMNLLYCGLTCDPPEKKVVNSCQKYCDDGLQLSNSTTPTEPADGARTQPSFSVPPMISFSSEPLVNGKRRKLWNWSENCSPQEVRTWCRFDVLAGVVENTCSCHATDQVIPRLARSRT